jgi:hypothetical protein
MGKGEIIEGQAEEISREQQADLMRLESMAYEEPGPIPEAEQEPERIFNPVDALAGFLTIGGTVAGWVGYRRVSGVWAEETCRGVAEKAVPVLQKSAWGSRLLEFLDTGAGVEEIALAMYLAPVVLATVAAAKADTAERVEPKKRDDVKDAEIVDEPEN